jgi:hypothetical protein
VILCQDPIPEVIPSQKCRMNVGPILNGYRAVDVLIPRIPYPHFNNSLVKGREWWDQMGKRTGLPQSRGPGGK